MKPTSSKLKQLLRGIFRISGSNKEMAVEAQNPLPQTGTAVPSANREWLLQLLMDVKYDRETPHAAKQLIEQWHKLENKL